MAKLQELIFEENFDSYTGKLLVSNGSFLDNKFEEVLKASNIKFDKVNLMKLSSKFTSEVLYPNLGVNFYIIRKGKVIKHIDTFIGSFNLINIIEDHDF